MQDGSFPHRSQIPPGTRLSGFYEIEQVIAAGGMGEVYKGHTIETGDTVAIKVMLPEFAENDAAMALFRKEASALHNLQHEAIVRYYIFTVEPVLRRPYLAMEFVEGRPLSEMLKQGPLSFEAVQTLRQRLANGLQAAHERGIIHRDVSPDNVIVPASDVGRAKIIDFGIARSSIGREGTVIGSGFAGKINYVSPEQLGLFGGDVTGKSDIYSLGLLLIEALTGRPIDMGGSQVDIIEKRRKVPDLGAIDLRIRPLIERMLQPAPSDRPDSMAEVAAWQIGGSHQYGGRYETSPHRGASSSTATRRRPILARLAVTGALAVLLIGGAGGAYYYFGLQPAIPAVEQPPPPALGGTAPGQLATAERPPRRPATAVAPTPATPAVPGLAAPTLTPASPNSASAVAPETATAVASAPSSGTTTPPPTPPLTQSRPRPTPDEPPSLSSPDRQQAALTPPAATPEPSPATRAGEITRYIHNYRGGDCLYIFPVAVSANGAQIEGYGADVAPFMTLNEAFKQSIGFEALIDFRQVLAAQCPALTFLGKLRGNSALAPRITVINTDPKSGQILIKSGQSIDGEIDNYGNRHIELLLVSDDGTVYNVTRLLKPTGEGKSFRLRLELTNPTGALPQLLVAVASTQPLAMLNPSAGVAANDFFPRVFAEAERSGLKLGGSAKYFKLGP